MARILITGAGGQLGRELTTELARRGGHDVLALSRAELDITDGQAVRDRWDEFQPQWCFNCAAYAAVDKAEAEPDLAQAINIDGAANVARACVEQDCRLVHFSSDYVYTDGPAQPRREEDPTEPQGIYAKSKLDGEERLLGILPTAAIIRTSWLYSSFGNNFVKTMLRLGRERDELGVVYDQIGGPTYARDLTRYLLDIAFAENGDRLRGIFNFSNAGVASWYDFCLAIHELSSITGCHVRPIDTAEYPTPAPRPGYSVLHTGKIRELGGPIRHWREALAAMLTVS